MKETTTASMVQEVFDFADDLWLTVDEVIAELPEHRSRQAVRPILNTMIEAKQIERRERDGKWLRFEYRKAQA